VALIVVGMADCQVANSTDQILVTYALGSCIGLAVYDSTAKVGGMLHFMLPDSTIDPARGRANPCMFADTGIPLLLDQVCGRGASKRRLIVRAAGGAQMMDRENTFQIGKRNYQAMRRILWKAGVLLQGEAIGGTNSRTIRLEIGTGDLWLQEAGQERALNPVHCQKGGDSWHIAS
jgi:chemotaxis protein CheD